MKFSINKILSYVCILPLELLSMQLDPQINTMIQKFLSFPETNSSLSSRQYDYTAQILCGLQRMNSFNISLNNDERENTLTEKSTHSIFLPKSLEPNLQEQDDPSKTTKYPRLIAQGHPSQKKRNQDLANRIKSKLGLCTSVHDFKSFVNGFLAAGTYMNNGGFNLAIREFDKKFNPSVAILKTTLDGQGNTLIHKAAKRGQVYVLQYLVEKGIDINTKNGNDKTPYQLAQKYHRSKTVREIKKIIDDKSIKKKPHVKLDNDAAIKNYSEDTERNTYNDDDCNSYTSDNEYLIKKHKCLSYQFQNVPTKKKKFIK